MKERGFSFVNGLLGDGFRLHGSWTTLDLPLAKPGAFQRKLVREKGRHPSLVEEHGKIFFYLGKRKNGSSKKVPCKKKNGPKSFLSPMCVHYPFPPLCGFVCMKKTYVQTLMVCLTHEQTVGSWCLPNIGFVDPFDDWAVGP